MDAVILPRLAAIVLFLLVSCTTAAGTPDSLEPPSFGNTVVTLTFDDGDADTYQARSVLAANGLHATWYVISGFIGAEDYLTEEQLRGLHADGNEIGGHTLSHAKLTEVRGAELRRQVCQDRLNLLSLGFDAVSFAYPFGHYDELSRQAVQHCGYNSARTVVGGPESVPPTDAYALRAFPYIVSDVRLPKMRRYVTDAGGGWVIFIFHHICNNCDEYSVDLETFTAFANWLGEQQARGLPIMTVGEVVGGDVKPAAAP